MKRLLLSGLMAVTAQAVDVSGSYENVGMVVGSIGTSDQNASFRGLLGLEFDLPLARAKFSETARIVVTQTDSTFKVSCRDADNNETWNGRWERDLGFDFDQKQVKLLFSSKTRKDDGYLFRLSLVGDGQLLLVEVTDVHASTFGPLGKPLGIFAFERTPAKRRPVASSRDQGPEGAPSSLSLDPSRLARHARRIGAGSPLGGRTAALQISGVGLRQTQRSYDRCSFRLRTRPGNEHRPYTKGGAARQMCFESPSSFFT